jgi:hypothetical protein
MQIISTTGQSLPLWAAKLLNLFELTKKTMIFTPFIYVFFYIFCNFAPHLQDNSI